MRPPLSLYGDSLLRMADDDGGGAVRVRLEDGTCAPLALRRYLDEPDWVDEALLGRVRGPVLDVGCGPGRHLHGLARRGVFAMGVDLSEEAIALARRRGVFAVRGSVFDEIPGDYAWRTALLLDGNIGIGGSPVCLLTRLRSLLAEDGLVLVELADRRVDSGPVRARLEGFDAHGHDEVSGWFDWARVTPCDVARIAAAAGLGVESVQELGGRSFARLVRSD